MSPDLPPPEPADVPPPSPITRTPPVPPGAIRSEPRPLPDLRPDDDVADALPPDDFDWLRQKRESEPPRVPHPGFWWAVLWCLLMLLVAQVIPAVVVAVVVIAWKMVLAGSVLDGLQEGMDLQGSRAYLMGAFAGAQIALTAFSLLVLRLAAGRAWRREVALRLPGLGHLVLAVLGWPALSLASSGLYALVQQMLPGLVELPSYFVTGLLTAVAGTGYYLTFRAVTGRDWGRRLADSGPAAQVGAGGTTLLVLLALAFGVFQLVRPYLPQFTMLGDKGMMEGVVKQVREWPVGLAVLIIGLGPGLGEELWCRAFLGRGLVGRHGVVMGVLLTSMFFGAIHLDPHQGTMAALMGVALHFAYLTTRSLWIPMLLHTLNNSLAVIADKLPDVLKKKLEDAETDPTRIEPLLYAAAALLLVSVGWALYASRARLARVDGSSLPPWQPPFPGVVYPPEGSGTAVVRPWPGLLPTLAVAISFASLVGVIAWR